MDQFYVKRCVAVPGDTFIIENGILNLIQDNIDNPVDSLGCLFQQQELSQMSRAVFLPDTWNCFPFDTLYYQWNIKDFGPIYIPGKGDELKLNLQNIALYKPLIQYETGQTITIKEEQFFLCEELLLTYTFTQNYYFMAGDYVLSSHDSRYWGLLPEDFIVGKATFIWKSKNPENNKYRWNRFFKIIK